METRVRFIVVGAFALAGVLGLFLFVYWIEAGGGLAAKRTLRVEFQGSAGGLRQGSAVQFNGVRIGEVTRLAFDPAHADIVDADLAVDASAPLRADARVTVETQGMLGASVVAISGGGAASAPLGDAPLRAVAAPALLEEARSALSDIRAVVADNRAPLRDIMANLDTFSAALGRNAGRIDGLVASLDKFLGGGPKPPPPQFLDLAAPGDFPALPPLKAQIAVADIGVPTAFHTQKILHRDGVDKPFTLGEAQWSDDTAKLIQIKLLEAFENAHLGGQVTRAFDQGAPDFQLMIDLRRFDVDLAAQEAVVELSARLVGKDGRVAQARVFRAAAPCAAPDGAAAAAALSVAFDQTATALVVWTAEGAR